MVGSAQPAQFTWEKDIRFPYEKILASVDEKAKIKTLEGFVSRSHKLIKAKIIGFDEFDNLDEIIFFLEQLLIVLNQCHTALNKALPDFDDQILPIIEKYSSLLVHQSNITSTHDECMQRLIKFLHNLPLHPELKILPQIRTKQILSWLIDCTKTSVVAPSENSHTPETEKIKNVEESPSQYDKLQKTVNKLEIPSSSRKLHEPATTSQLEETKKSSTPPFFTPEGSVNHSLTEVDSAVFSCTTSAKHQNDLEPSSSSLVENVLIDPKQRLSNRIRTTDLTELRRKLRSRFPIPWNVTPSEKYLLRRILRLIKSKQSHQLSVWSVSNLIPMVKYLSDIAPSNHSEVSIPDPNSLTVLPDNCRVEDIGTENISVKIHDKEETENESEFINNVSNSSNSELTDSFKSLQSDRDNTDQKEDNFDKLKNLTQTSHMETELTLSDVELMEEMESTLRRIEKEQIEDSANDSDLFTDSILNINTQLEKLPIANITGEHCKTPNSSNNVKGKSSPTPISSAERRRSSRLAGLPALPLIFTQQPLPSKRRTSTPSSTGKHTSVCQANSAQEHLTNELNQTRTIEETGEEQIPPLKKSKLNDSLDINLTPNFPKKPVRRRIVSIHPDPYMFVASDEEPLIERQPESFGANRFKENSESTSKRSTVTHSPEIVDLSPARESHTKSLQEIEGAICKKTSDQIQCSGTNNSLQSSSSHKLEPDKSNDSAQEILEKNTNCPNNQNALIQKEEIIAVNKTTWKEVRQFLPVCWAEILEQHVKLHHPDESLVWKTSGKESNVPIVFCCPLS